MRWSLGCHWCRRAATTIDRYMRTRQSETRVPQSENRALDRLAVSEWRSMACYRDEQQQHGAISYLLYWHNYIDIILTLDWHSIDIRLTLDWDYIDIYWHNLDIIVTLYWHHIDIILIDTILALYIYGTPPGIPPQICYLQYGLVDLQEGGAIYIYYR